jgi:hypothetical protein
MPGRRRGRARVELGAWTTPPQARHVKRAGVARVMRGRAPISSSTSQPQLASRPTHKRCVLVHAGWGRRAGARESVALRYSYSFGYRVAQCKGSTPSRRTRSGLGGRDGRWCLYYQHTHTASVISPVEVAKKGASSGPVPPAQLFPDDVGAERPVVQIHIYLETHRGWITPSAHRR